jgi:hypothetical protein
MHFSLATHKAHYFITLYESIATQFVGAYICLLLIMRNTAASSNAGVQAVGPLRPSGQNGHVALELANSVVFTTLAKYQNIIFFCF